MQGDGKVVVPAYGVVPNEPSEEQVDTSNEKYQDDLEYFVDYARVDWVPIEYLFVAASNIVGADASLQQMIEVTEQMLLDLFSSEVCVGDLTEHEPGFKKWPGTPTHWLGRIRRHVEERGDIPNPGELAWLHVAK